MDWQPAGGDPTLEALEDRLCDLVQSPCLAKRGPLKPEASGLRQPQRDTPHSFPPHPLAPSPPPDPLHRSAKGRLPAGVH